MKHDLKLGSLLPNTWQPRDAVHVPVIPVEAADTLLPGQHISLLEGKAIPATGNGIGVVDPFLTAPVKTGEVFLLMLYPGTITALRHEWSHSAFPSITAVTGEERAESEAWLREFIGSRYKDDNLVPMYKDVIEEIINGLHCTIYGREEHTPPPSEFWFHLERLTGRTFDRDDMTFSCVC